MDIIAQAEAFAQQDPDPTSADQLRLLIAKARAGEERAFAELDDAFGGRLHFGTAGLRGRIGPGTRRMNRVVVSQATYGLGTYLLAQGPREGFDATAAASSAN